MTQSCAMPTVTGWVPVIIACLPVLGSVTLKVSGPAWLTVALVMFPSAQAWVTMS
jgi:hypothetical protein